MPLAARSRLCPASGEGFGEGEPPDPRAGVAAEMRVVRGWALAGGARGLEGRRTRAPRCARAAGGEASTLVLATEEAWRPPQTGPAIDAPLFFSLLARWRGSGHWRRAGRAALLSSATRADCQIPTRIDIVWV